MTLLKNEIDIRALPDLYTHLDGTPVTPESWDARRAELRTILSENEYGYAPGGAITNQLDDPSVVTVRESRKPDTNMCAGKVTGEWFDVCFPTPSYVDGIEVYNSNPRHCDYNEKAEAMAKENGLFYLSGSDAHRVDDLGKVGILTEKEIKNSDDFIEVIRSGRYELIKEK